MKCRKIHLKEDLSPSLPYWLKKEFDGNLKSILLKNNIALDKVKFIQSDFPSTSNQVTKMKQSNKYPIFFLGNRDIYIPGIYGDNKYSLKYDNYYKNIPMKNIIKDATDFGYIDLSDASNTTIDIKKQRKEVKQGTIPRGKGQYLYKETEYIPGHNEEGKWVPGYDRETGKQEWRTLKGEDKSGYILNPDKYKNILDNLDLSNYSIVLGRYYNKLNNIKTEIQNKLSNWDIKEYGIPKFGAWGIPLYNILDNFNNVVNIYQQILKGIDKIVNSSKLTEEEKKEYIQDYATGFYGIGNLRDKVEDLQDELKKEYFNNEV